MRRTSTRPRLAGWSVSGRRTPSSTIQNPGQRQHDAVLAAMRQQHTRVCCAVIAGAAMQCLAARDLLADATERITCSQDTLARGPATAIRGPHTLHASCC